MSLTLYFHPLASFCWKALIALYENETPFVPHVVDLGDETSRTDFLKVWPIGKFPVLRDGARSRVIPESTVIIDYLDLHYPGRTRFLPADPDLAWEARLRDRLYDLYLHEPMQKVVTDRIRPPGMNDPHGVEQAKAMLKTSIGIVDQEMATKRWAMGDAFGLADCAAAPALYYANKVMPFADSHGNAAAYLRRLMERPSFARVLEEAQPYMKFFPT